MLTKDIQNSDKLNINLAPLYSALKNVKNLLKQEDNSFIDCDKIVDYIHDAIMNTAFSKAINAVKLAIYNEIENKTRQR